MKPIDLPPHCDNCTNNNDIFCALSQGEKRMLSIDKNESYFKKGSIIFSEGEHANNLYCVYKGKIKLTKLGKDGKEQIVRFASSGNILGYRSLLGNTPYQAKAIALDDSYICVLSKERFFSIIEKNPMMSLKIIQLLTEDLKSAEQHLIDITQKTVKERVAEALLILKNTFGFLMDGETLNVKISRADIADMAGTTTESTIRTLALLHEEKIIQLNGKSIIITNINKLINCAAICD